MIMHNHASFFDNFPALSLSTHLSDFPRKYVTASSLFSSSDCDIPKVTFPWVGYRCSNAVRLPCLFLIDQYSDVLLISSLLYWN